jgi:hypothetical protein
MLMNKTKMSSKKCQNRCSTCGRLARGHVGPAGPKCNMVPRETDDNEDNVSQPDFDSVNSARDTVLQELVSQMGQLTVHLQKVQDDIHDVKARC